MDMSTGGHVPPSTMNLDDCKLKDGLRGTHSFVTWNPEVSG